LVYTWQGEREGEGERERWISYLIEILLR